MVPVILGFLNLVGPGHAFWSALEPRFSIFKPFLKNLHVGGW